MPRDVVTYRCIPDDSDWRKKQRNYHPADGVLAELLTSRGQLMNVLSIVTRAGPGVWEGDLDGSGTFSNKQAALMTDIDALWVERANEMAYRVLWAAIQLDGSVIEMSSVRTIALRDTGGQYRDLPSILCMYIVCHRHYQCRDLMSSSPSCTVPPTLAIPSYRSYLLVLCL